MHHLLPCIKTHAVSAIHTHAHIHRHQLPAPASPVLTHFITMAFKRSLTGADDMTALFKKKRTEVPISSSRKRLIKTWDVSEKVTVGVFVHLDRPMIDIVNTVKPTASLILSADTFHTLHAVKSSIGTANFEYNIGEDVLLKREQYKGKWYISVRQHYKDARGQMRPAKQGANVTEDVWAVFTSAMNQIGE
jgi:hypothetical protein